MSINTESNTLLALDTGVAVSTTYGISLDESGNDITETVTACTYYINYSASDLQALFDVSYSAGGEEVDASFYVIPSTAAIVASIQSHLRSDNVYSTADPGETGDFDDVTGRSTLLEDIESTEYQAGLDVFRAKIAHKFTIGQANIANDGSSNDVDTALNVLQTLGIVNSSITDFDFATYHTGITVANNGSAPKNVADDLLDAENILTVSGTSVDFASLPDGYAFAVALTVGGTMNLQFTVNTDDSVTGSTADNSDLTGQIAGQSVSQGHSFSGTTVNIALRKTTALE